MEEKRAIDTAGAVTLILFASLMAFNQVVIKFTVGGFGPVFQAGLRSALACLVLLVWIRVFRVSLAMPAGAVRWAIVSGLLFTAEFIALFIAMDHTSVAHASIILYSMPVWLALAGHILLPGEQLTGLRMIGLLLAMGGVALALSSRGGGATSLFGDVLALIAALSWAGIALTLRATPLAGARPEAQLLYQLVISAVLMLALAPLFGPFLRAPDPVHYAGLAFQAVFVASLGFLLWFKLLTIYKAGGVASFSFLSPVLAVIFGWLLLGEQIAATVWIAMILVAAGVFLINRR